MNKRMGFLRACLVMVVVGIVLLAGFPAMAAGPLYGTPSSSGSASASSSSAADQGGLRVTGYTLENDNSGTNFTGELHRNNSLTVVLNIFDNRPAVAGYTSADELRPTGRLNSASFTVPNASQIIPSNAQRSVDGKEWTYSLRFQNLTYTGVGRTFRCDIFYAGNNTVEVATYQFDINQCVEYVPPASSDASSSSSGSTVVKGTGFVLKEASYGQTQIFAGQPFTLSVTLLATNGDHNVENVTVGITPAKELSLLDGSSLAYIGTVKPGQSVPASFQLVPGANVEEGSYSAVIDIKGVDAKTGESVSAQVSISIPVVQPERFEIFSTQLPTDITAGMDDGAGFGTITLVNQGKGKVGNVSVDIQGAGLTTEEGKQYIGHMAGGEQKSADFNIKAETPGQIAALVLVSYESTSGEKKELTYEFTINVEEGIPDMGGEGMFPEPELPPASTGMPPWGWVLIALAVVGVGVAVVIVVKRRKAKKAAALEDDYDEDE